MRWRLALALLAVSLSICAALGWMVLHDRRLMLRERQAVLENRAEILAAYIGELVRGIDLSLQSQQEAWTAGRVGPEMPVEAIHRGLALRQAGQPAAPLLLVLDAGGRGLASSRAPLAPDLDLSRQPVVLAQREAAGDRLEIGLPQPLPLPEGRARWVLPFSRPLLDAGGRLTGIAVALLPLDHLRGFYRTLQAGGGGRVQLVDARGALLSGHTALPDRAPKTGWAGWSPDRAAARPREEFGEGTGEESGDGSGPEVAEQPPERPSERSPEWLLAAQPVPGLPLEVRVAQAQAEVLAPWRLHAWFSLAIAVLLCGLVLAFGLSLERQWAQRQQAAARRAQRMTALAGASAELLSAPTEQVVLERAEAIARRLLPCAAARASLSGVAPLHHDAASLARPMLAVNGREIGEIRLWPRAGLPPMPEDQALLAQLAQLAGLVIDRLRGLAEQAGALALAAREREAASLATAHLHTVYSTISDAVCVINDDGTIRYLNGIAERLVGRPAEALVGRDLWEAFPEARRSIAFGHVEACLRQRQPSSHRYHIDGGQRWISLRLVPAEGCIAAYGRDVTEEVVAEERLRQSQKMEAVGRLTGGIAHDFNNLLGIIIANLDLLRMLPQEAERNPARLEDALRAALRGSEVTAKLMALARQQPVERVALDLCGLLRDMRPLLARALTSSIRLSLWMEEPLWPTCLGNGEFEDIILNLALNARDAMPEGGRLTIAARNRVIAEGGLTPAPDLPPGDYVQVSITDTGHGMPAAVAARAFEPFFTTKPQGQGTGLGLSMVYGYVRGAGGTVHLSSEPGEGTTLQVYLPRASGEAMAPAAPAPELARPVPGQGEHILLVDDEPMLLEATRDHLRHIGYRVSIAAQGAQALRLLREDASIALLLTDMVMPEMDGLALVKQCRALRPGCPAVVMSGFAEMSGARQAELMRLARFIGKPFDMRALSLLLRDCLDLPPRTPPGEPPSLAPAETAP